LIEIEDLSWLVVSSLDNQVSTVDYLHISSRVQGCDNMEWSLNVESKFFVKFTLGWLSLPLVNVDNVPLLMDLSVLGFIALDVSAFCIGSTLNIEIFVYILLEGSDIGAFNSE
jgi:hypothetical protein